MTNGGPVVLLTGATGRIGGAVARRVLAVGGKVAAVVRRPWQVAKVHEALGSTGVLVGVVAALDTEAAAGFVKGANDALGPITAFVGCAGCTGVRDAGREPQGDLAEQLEANLQANATVCRAAMSGMRRRGHGVIAFVGAATGVEASVNHLAAKAALTEYARRLQHELIAHGVTVHVVAPATADAVVDQLVHAVTAAPSPAR